MIDHRDLFDEVGNYHNHQGIVAEEHFLELANSLQNYADEATQIKVNES